MRHTFVSDRIIHGARGDITTAHNRAAKHRHHPCVIPAIAVKQWHDGQIDGCEGQLPADNRAHGHQIRATMMVDDTLRATRGAGCIIEREALPFIGRHDPFELGIAALKQRVISLIMPRSRIARSGVRHLDDQRSITLHFRDGGFDAWQELRINQGDLSFAVIKNIGDGALVETCVDGVQDRATCGNAKMRFGLRGDVGKQGRDNVARCYAKLCKTRGQPRAAVMILRISCAKIIIDQCGLFRENLRSTAQMGQGCQSAIICIALV